MESITQYSRQTLVLGGGWSENSRGNPWSLITSLRFARLPSSWPCHGWDSSRWLPANSDLLMDSPGFLKASLHDNYCIIHCLHVVIHFSINCPPRIAWLLAPLIGKRILQWQDFSLQYLTRSKQYCLTRAFCLLFDHMSGVEMTLGMLFKIIIIAEAQQSRWSFDQTEWVALCPLKILVGCFQDGKIDMLTTCTLGSYPKILNPIWA